MHLRPHWARAHRVHSGGRRRQGGLQFARAIGRARAVGQNRLREARDARAPVAPSRKTLADGAQCASQRRNCEPRARAATGRRGHATLSPKRSAASPREPPPKSGWIGAALRSHRRDAAAADARVEFKLLSARSRGRSACGTPRSSESVDPPRDALAEMEGAARSRAAALKRPYTPLFDHSRHKICSGRVSAVAVRHDFPPKATRAVASSEKRSGAPPAPRASPASTRCPRGGRCLQRSGFPFPSPGGRERRPFRPRLRGVEREQHAGKGG
jgi:hypothetical protein